MMSEYWNSSPTSLPTVSNPIEKVCSPCCPASASKATMIELSSPPDSGTPTGTSDPPRQRHAARNVRHQPPLDRLPQRLQDQILPVRLRQALVTLLRPEIDGP